MISVVIQAGGKSVRMGQNKALLPFLGYPLILRVAERLARLTNDLLVIAPADPDITSLGLPVYPDSIPAAGPLGGLLSGFRVARHELVAVVACDMPFVSANLIEEQVRRMRDSQVDVVLPVIAGQAEPLHALYRRDTCLPAVTSALTGGLRRLVDFHSQVKVMEMQETDLRRLDPSLRAFMNLNTPQELAVAEQLARSHPGW